MTLASDADIAALFIDGDELLDGAGSVVRGWLQESYREAGGADSALPVFVTAIKGAEHLVRDATLSDPATGRVWRVKNTQQNIERQVATLVLEEQ